MKNPDRSEGLPRGMGNGTLGRSATEQERPSCVALEWENGGYKPKAKACRAQRESEGGIVPMTAGRTKTRGGKAPCFSYASARR